MRLERGRPLLLLIGDGGCPGHMAIEARMRNQVTGLGQSLKAIAASEVGTKGCVDYATWIADNFLLPKAESSTQLASQS